RDARRDEARLVRETWLAAPHALGGHVIGPVDGRAKDWAIHVGNLESGQVQDGDGIVIILALEVLVAAKIRIKGKSLDALGHKSHRLDLRINRLGEVLSKGQAEDERTEIVNGGHGANIVGKDGFRVELDVFAALLGGGGAGLAGYRVDAGGGNAAIEHAKIIEVEEGILAGTGAEVLLQRPAALREIFAADGSVHAAIDGPVEGIADHGALGVRSAEIGDEEAALPAQSLHRRRRIR